ncbi:hypothetical protein QBC37DRAFT_278981 [Rhypophila decipiens]|uniref:Fibronectin type-III domain-containing protein n=1 Tax=Rhypophila decipiens TaxID=261697 RepID=A0AAN6YEH5_9PEZI|nr:hypothetical protein QBC37DRAFT_278981 [Rhypophila decipiens]
MSWTSWTSLVPTLLILSAVLAWWFTEPKTARINLIAAVGVVLFGWAVAPELSRDLSTSLYTSSINSIASLHLEVFVVKHANMLFTGAAVVWLVRRAWQTLWKPVPELISILGVDVPDPPEVSLAGIRADAATLNWTRPLPNRSVQKFLIQVNGVVVGDVAANQEPAIVVTGLKPDHFYNVRVISVGSNNFQAGSRVIRLRTFGQDGRPQLGNARLPSNFTAEEPYGSKPSETSEESGGRTTFPALETAATSEVAPSPSRDPSSANLSGPRRNTVTRRHSPSTTSIDQAPIRDAINENSKKTLPELTERFESIRKETDEVASLIAKEDGDNKALLVQLENEKREKKKEQKKKEEQTEKLKRDVNSSDRSMRNALQRKAQKEKALREKEMERQRYEDEIQKWDDSIQVMENDQADFETKMKELAEEREKKLESSRGENSDLQAECSRLEAELKERRDQVRELEEERKKLPGGELDAESRDKDEQLRRKHQQRQREMSATLQHETATLQRLEDQIQILTNQLQQIPQPNYAALYTQPNSSGLDFDHATISQLKRRSRNSNSLSSISISSPLPAYSQMDPSLTVPIGFASARSANVPPGFAPGPFGMGLTPALPSRLDEAGIRGSSAPLSPSAAALLPSNILDDFDDDDDFSPQEYVHPEPFFPSHGDSPKNDPQSPTSSDRAMSILSSPRGSSHNLAFAPFGGEKADIHSLNAGASLPSPTATEPPANKLSGLFSFPRSRTAKVMEKEGPALGSLKQGQSQSFPRQTDDLDGLTNKRRTSVSGWNIFNRNSAGPDILEGHAVSSRMFSAKNFNPFSNSGRSIFAERDPSSPRPASIASNDFPRPSTDSGSIWGPPTDAGALGKSSRFWSPDNNINAPPWSRNPSRRPSLHGSPSALKTTLASAEDEILDEGMLPNAKNVGVIGSRPPPPSIQQPKNLNPHAQPFIGGFFSKSKSDKDGGKEKSKSKDDRKSKDKTKDKSKNKDAQETAAPDTPQVMAFEMESPSDSRMSRDGVSIHTQTSVSESRDSLSLDMSFSNTPSEPASVGLSTSVKDEGVVRKLFRKSSSSKFSLPGRLGGKDSSLFKKGPSSTASAGNNSDRMASLERSSIGDFDDVAGDETPGSGGSFLGKSYDSVTSSPSLGPSVSTISNGGKHAIGKEGGAGSVSGGSVSKSSGSRWLSGFGKKGKNKEKESLDLDRAESTTSAADNE